MPEAVHGEAVDLLDPHLELLGRAELVQLVRGVDLPQEPAQLVVAVVVLQTHLGREHSCGALHHAGQQPGPVLLLLEERPTEGGEQHQALQAQLRALRPVGAATPGEEVKEQLGDPLVAEHVPAVGHHDRALLVRGFVWDGPHEVKGEAVARQLQDLLHEPALLRLVRDVDLPGGDLLQCLDGDGEDRGQRRVPEAQGRPPEAGHGGTDRRLHVCGQVRVDLEPKDPMQRRGLQELADPLRDILVLRPLQPRQLDDPTQQAHHRGDAHGRAAVQVGAVLGQVVEEEVPHLLLLIVRHGCPVGRDELYQAGGREDERVRAGRVGQDELELRHPLRALHEGQERLMSLLPIQLGGGIVQRMAVRLQLLQLPRVHY
mmetsp:Transcript_23717/g.70597  ORF Transcript_23717/g.70597 Transcript_23717/m.70597 type:complete len:373 (+) Transcript_23717:684-1802(+)